MHCNATIDGIYNSNVPGVYFKPRPVGLILPAAKYMFSEKKNLQILDTVYENVTQSALFFAYKNALLLISKVNEKLRNAKCPTLYI